MSQACGSDRAKARNGYEPEASESSKADRAEPIKLSASTLRSCGGSLEIEASRVGGRNFATPIELFGMNLWQSK
jgi:hypothetical protein